MVARTAHQLGYYVETKRGQIEHAHKGVNRANRAFLINIIVEAVG